MRTAQVRHGPLREELSYVGSIRARREVTVVARVAGTLVRLPVAEGAPARQGEVLAELSAPDARARLRRLRAQEGRARGEEVHLCERLETDLRLAAAGAIARVQLDASRRACQRARAATRAAAAGRAEAGTVATREAERAPFPGRVLRHLVQPGQNALPGQPLLLFGDEALEARVDVAEEDLRRGVRPGAQVLVRWGDGAWRPSSVARVGASTSGPGRTLEVAVPLPKEGFESAAPGMSIDVAFVLAELQAASAVPLRALEHTGDEAVLFEVVSGPDAAQLRRRVVRPTLRAEGWVGVEPPLEGGARVVVGELGGLSAC